MNGLRLLEPSFGSDVELALNRLISSPFSSSTLSPFQERQPLQMRIDVTESPTEYLVRADIPGVKKEDINVRVNGSIVQIDAETRTDKESRTNGDRVLRKERYFGMLSRSFSVGQEIEVEKVQAKYKDGVLTLNLPKKTKTTNANKVEIQ